MLGVPHEPEAAEAAEGAEADDITETRRLERPPGTLVGVPMPDLGRRVLEFDDHRFVSLAGAAGGFMKDRGAVFFTAVGEALPVATVLLGTAAGLLRMRTGPLVLLDIEYPYHGLCTLLDLEGVPGLSELLASRGGPGDVIFVSREAGVGFLGPGRAALSLWDIAGARMQDVLRVLADVFGRVLALAPPLAEGALEAAVAAAGAAGIPAALLTVHPAAMPAEAVRSALDAVPANLNVLGRAVV